jgi:hypothetical protein
MTDFIFLDFSIQAGFFLFLQIPRKFWWNASTQFIFPDFCIMPRKSTEKNKVTGYKKPKKKKT